MRYVRLGCLGAAALLCSACFQFSTVLRVSGDGSGTIDQRMLFTQAAVGQLRQFAAMTGGGQPFEPVSEQQARDAAKTMGPGVTYVSSAPIDTSDGVGRDAHYSFTDISQLRLDQGPPSPAGLGLGPSTGAKPSMSFALTHQPDGHALLTVRVPQLPLVPGGTQAGPFGNMPPADQVAMLRPMLAGARMSIAIEPEGALVRTSSPYVDGRRVTIVDVSLDALLSDPTLVPRLQAAKDAADAKSILRSAPDVHVNLDPELTIEFTPR